MGRIRSLEVTQADPIPMPDTSLVLDSLLVITTVR